MESLDKPPSYTIQKEQLGYHRKFWTVRYRGKFVTAFATKGEASGWIYRKETTKYQQEETIMIHIIARSVMASKMFSPTKKIKKAKAKVKQKKVQKVEPVFDMSKIGDLYDQFRKDR